MFLTPLCVILTVSLPPEAQKLLDSPVHHVLEAEVQNDFIQAIPDVLW